LRDGVDDVRVAVPDRDDVVVRVEIARAVGAV